MPIGANCHQSFRLWEQKIRGEIYWVALNLDQVLNLLWWKAKAKCNNSLHHTASCCTIKIKGERPNFHTPWNPFLDILGKSIRFWRCCAPINCAPLDNRLWGLWICRLHLTAEFKCKRKGKKTKQLPYCAVLAYSAMIRIPYNPSFILFPRSNLNLMFTMTISPQYRRSTNSLSTFI